MPYVAGTFANAIRTIEDEFDTVNRDYEALRKEHDIVVRALERIADPFDSDSPESLAKIAADAIKAAGI